MNFYLLMYALVTVVIAASILLYLKRVRTAGVRGVQTTRGTRGTRGRKLSGGDVVLLVFLFIVLAVAILTIRHYWSSIATKTDLVFSVAWLLIAMIGGMFVQVISAHWRENKSLSKIQAGALIYPLLFSVIVFYPVWLLATNGELNYLTFYTAFLNGYFWETIVSRAKPAEQED